MSKPTNGAARNVMSEFERQCYDWGWKDAEERIIQLLHSDAGRNILVKGGNAFGNAIMLEVLIKGEEQ